jgi:hypothetical protein
MNGIPKIFHFIWVDRYDEEKEHPEIPQANMDCFHQWRFHHPDWTFFLWNGRLLRRLITERYSFFLPYYSRYRHWVCRVDAAKYFLMHSYGGIYLDFDIECVRPIEPLLAQCEGARFIVSKEPQSTCKRAYKNILRYVPSNGFLCCEPNYEGIEEIVRLLIDHAALEERHILLATGPPILYKFIEEHAQWYGGVQVLDSQYLFGAEPGADMETISRIREKQTCYGIHRFDNTWCL